MIIVEPFIILVALLCGMASRAIGFPALIGYLTAGFVLHEFNMDSGPLLETLAELGITLLLFTIGLTGTQKTVRDKGLGDDAYTHGGSTAGSLSASNRPRHGPARIRPYGYRRCDYCLRIDVF